MGRARDRASADLNGQEFILDADADTSISADTDDQIDIKIAGADDFAFKANTFEVQTGSNIDMNGTELVPKSSCKLPTQVIKVELMEVSDNSDDVMCKTNLEV